LIFEVFFFVGYLKTPTKGWSLKAKTFFGLCDPGCRSERPPFDLLMEAIDGGEQKLIFKQVANLRY